MRNLLIRGVLCLVVGFAVLVAGGGWWLSAPGHQGQPSDHFDGEVFVNLNATELPDGMGALRTFPFTERREWADWREITQRPAPPSRVEDGLRATFINHATVLLQVGGLNVLTDPIYSERCSAVQWAGPARHHAPGVPFEELPPIDVVIISHNHYDHLDLPTLARLAERDDPLVVVGLGNAALLRDNGMDNVVELDWGQSHAVGELDIIGQRSRHFSGRGLFDRMKTLWLAYVLETPAGAVYFGGDTGWGDHFAASGQAHGPFVLSLLPIGAYEPRDFMAPVHIDPAQAVQAHLDLRSERSIGIHHGTFRLSYEGDQEPVQELAVAAAEAGLAEGAFQALEPGEAWVISR